MIALLISGSQDEYRSIKSALEEKDYSVVQYDNFLKAYDNLEEIHPDVIVVSAQDYPRHWKIIASTANFRLSKKVKTIILVNLEFSDKKEIESLPVFAFTYDTEENFDKSLFFEALTTNISDPKINYNQYFDEEDFAAPTVQEILANSTDDYISTGTKCNFAYMNPSVMSIITGKVISFVYPEICFLPDRKEGFESLYIGQILDDCSLKTEIGLSSVKTCVTDISDTITMHICQGYYGNGGKKETG